MNIAGSLTDEQLEELSSLMLTRCRELDDALYPRGGWSGWTTGGMRMMTDSILIEVLERVEQFRREDRDD